MDKSEMLDHNRSGGENEVPLGGKFYIYSSKAAGKQGGLNEQIDSNTDKFLSLLQNQCIILKETPSPSANLDDSDEWAKWLKRFDNTGEFSIKVGGTPKRIESFSFHFKLSLTGSSSVVFSSSRDALRSSFGPDQETNIPAPGIRSEDQLLYCGLDLAATTKELKTSVKEVFNYVGQPGTAEALPGKISALELTLDTSKNVNAKRNALWYNPAFYSQTTLRLQFQIDKVDDLRHIVESKLSDLTITEASVICKKILIAAETENGPDAVDQGDVAFSLQCEVNVNEDLSAVLAGSVQFGDSSITLIFRPESKGDILEVILTWLSTLVSENLHIVKEIFGRDNVFEKNVKLREVAIELAANEDGKPSGISGFGLKIEVGTKVGKGAGQKTPVFFLNYRWSKGGGKMGAIWGHLWTGSDLEGERETSPYYEWWTNMKPITTDTPANSIELCSIIPDQTIENVPDCIPTEVTRASIFLSQTTFAIGGTIATRKSQSDVPHPSLGWIQLDASYTWGKSREFDIKMGIMADLPSSPSSGHGPAILMGKLQYNSSNKTWELGASLEGLYASSLYEFFDSSSSDHIMPLIDSICIRDLAVNYKYAPVASEKKSMGSSFNIKGALLIAGLELDLEFKYEDELSFTAGLKPQDAQATIGDVVSSILGDAQLELPEFVANTQFSKGDTFHLEVQKKPKRTTKTSSTAVETQPKSSAESGDKSPGSFHFIATISIRKIKLIFAQYHSTEWKPQPNAPKTPSKRLLKVALQGLDIPEMELIGKMEQPFHGLSYIWIQDPTKKSKLPGLTRKEVKDLNDSLSADPLVFKDKFKNPSDADVIITAGSHLSILMNSSNGLKTPLLTYGFKSRGSSKKKQPASIAARGKSDTKEDDQEEDGSTAQVPFKKKSGPLSLKNIGLKYANKQFYILFDATFELGPLEFSLLGFSIGVRIKHLTEFPDVSKPAIEGMAVGFEKPPLTLAGVIRHGKNAQLEYYAGGLVVGFIPYEFQAAGFYGKATPPKQTPFTSIFVFAKLNGPLFELGFAEISGLTGGFGYNSDVRTPTPDRVVDFPFVATDKIEDSTGSAMKTLEALTSQGEDGWFHSKNEVYWAAAGLKVSAFQMLSIDAVVVVQFGSAVKLGVFAVAIADIPSTESKLKFAHVELGLAVVVDFDYGTMKVEGQLSPNSFILHPDCHLTGGFGLYYWFDGPLADKSVVGEFVFTLGGYHQAFDIPDGYPCPPRLAISWSLSKSLSITGEAYFAITPKACMGGGRLHASFAAGPIEAWFDAMADFLINYRPFKFIASASISVGIRCSIDILFIHTSVSAELSAELTLWGPPVAGSVHVNFWVTSFDINFGDSQSSADPIKLMEFYELVLQSSQKIQASSADPPRIQELESSEEVPTQKRSKNEGHTFLAQSGMVNSDESTESDKDTPWTVRAGSFSVVVSCKMAVQTASQGGKTVEHKADIFAKPMHLERPMLSTLAVDITQDGVQKNDMIWRMEKQVKSVPTALWDKYDRQSDPSHGNNHVKDLLNTENGTLSLMMAVRLTVPPPILSADKMPVFTIEDSDIVPLKSTKPFPAMSPSAEGWEPADPLPDSQQWEAVHKKWKQLSVETGNQGQLGFVSRWAEAFKWDKVKLSSLAGLPKRMDARFDGIFVAAPLISK